MVVIGLTGGIASGKSTAADYLERAGVPVVRADTLARSVVAPGAPALREVAEAFPGVVDPAGVLDRRALGRVVFSDPAARRRLEAITHPRIHRRMLDWLDERRRDGAPGSVCDIPLLYEVGYDREAGFLDSVWVVAVDPGTQLRRLMARDNLTAEAAAQRIQAQWPLERKAALADVVLDNRGTPDALREAVLAAWRTAVPGAGGA